jgi:cytoskeletal protein RodZ
VGAFGEKLRKQRELRGLELDDISNTTKISVRMLRALEDEHFDQLPGGVFNRGFVRAYARQVGLDQEETVADYAAALREKHLQQSLLPDFSDPAPEITPAAAPEPANHESPTNQLPDNILASDDFPANNNINDDSNDLNHELRRAPPRRQGRRNEARRNEDRRNEDLHNEDRSQQNPSTDSPALPDSATQAHTANPPASRYRQKYPAGTPDQPADESSAQVPWGKLAMALLLVTLTLAFWNFRPHAQHKAESHLVASSDQSSAPLSTPASTRTQPSGSSSSQTAGPAASSTASASQPDANPPATHRTAPKPPRTFTLLIRADETTWVSLTADGNPVVANETLIAPAHTSVRASREIVVKAGNAAGVSFLLNGKTIPAQGNEGETRTYVFDATGLLTTPQPQPPSVDR